MGQGRFPVFRDKSRRALAVNAFGNEGLLRGLSADGKERLGPAIEMCKHSRSLPVGALSDMVEALLPRARPAMKASAGILLATSVLALACAPPAALINNCDALVQLSEIDRALEVCTCVTRIQPDNPAAFYNLARVFALLGRAEDAFAALEKDYELGDRDREYLAGDDWFASLRSDPRFVELLGRMGAEHSADAP